MNPLIEILGLAFVVSLATNLVRRLLLTPEDMRKMAESQLYKRKLLEAKRKGDEKLVQKLMKKQEYYQKIDAEVGKKNILTLVITLAIFYAVYMLVGPLYGNTVVALLPGNLFIPFLSAGNKLTFAGWFILSLIAVGLPTAKVLGVGGMPEVSKDAEKRLKAG